MNKMNIKTKILLTFGSAAFLCLVFAGAVLFMAFSLKNAENDLNALNASVNRLLSAAAVFAALLPLIFIIMGVLLSGNLSKPLGFLADCISRIAETGNIFLDDDDYRHSKVLNKRGDEIGKISRSVGDMLAMFRDKIKTLGAIRDGDLTVKIVRRSDKDTIGSALVQMAENLNVMFGDIKNASLRVTEGAVKMDGGAKLLAGSSGEQAESVERLNRRVSGVAEQTSQKSDMAKSAASLSLSIKTLAEKGGGQMTEMTDAVNKINESSAAIGKVIKIIDDIAFQTNLLAINAGVEAARAGANGKGFAVVASEIRALAAKSQVAAHNIGDLIADSIERSKKGAEIAEETAASLREIVAGVAESSDLAEKIAELSESQARTIADINAEIDRISETVRQSSRTAEESARDSLEVSGQAGMLSQFIGKIKTF